MLRKFAVIIFFLSGLVSSCTGDDPATDREWWFSDLVVESPHDFKTGDAIGLFVEPADGSRSVNLKWIYGDDGTWKPAGDEDMIRFAGDGMPVNIYAYYPHTQQDPDGGITLHGVSRIMTGKTLGVGNDQRKIIITLHDRTAPVKVIVPDVDLLSSVTVTMLDVFAGGRIDVLKLGDEDDFAVSQTRSNQLLPFENGCYVAYLPEQVFEKDRHLLEITHGNDVAGHDVDERMQVSIGSEHTIVVNLSAANPADLPNTFMLKPGDEMYISVQKAYRMWREHSLLSSVTEDLADDVEAQVVWQEDQHEVIAHCQAMGSGEDALLHVKTVKDLAGNAVVGVNIGGEIRWSWQLWVSDYDPSPGGSGQVCEFNGLTWMDRNLGATGDPKAGGDRTFGLYYQWGRKDPFPTRGKIETTSVVADEKSNLAHSITHPASFITSSSGRNDWYVKTGNAGLDRWNDSQHQKTPFDPCPDGWRVAVADGASPWDGLSVPQDEGKWGNGWYFEPVPMIGYYPAAGQRTVTGGITYAGSAGFYYTAKPDATMRIDFTSINLAFGGGRAAARSVRCVKTDQ